jgi:cell division protease FtsH
MFVGVGASRVRSLFKKARQNSPCIIFIDEIDAIGKKRSTGATSSEHESTLTQILKEMDGFTPDSNIVVLAATNQPETLDSALVRPGRFDRHIPLVNPDLKGRIDILKIHLKNIIHDEVDYNHIALMTAGCSGADIANIVNEAAMTAVRRNEASVNTKHLEEAIEVVLAGKVKKSTILSKHEKELVAYHEIGHALVSMRLKNTKPIQKITIIPRTLGALGFVMHTPEDERFLQTKSEIVSDITVLLAGRCAEELMYNDCTTGASNDIEKATSMARAYVTKFGMSDKFGMIKLEGDNSQYLNTGSYRICSEETMTNVDNEVIKLLKECKENAMEILVNNKVLLLILAGVLVQEETIDGKRFMDIVAHVDSEQS